MFDSLHSLLTHTYAQEPLGHSTSASVHLFPQSIPELDNFVVRTRWGDLQSTSALIPLPRIPQGIMVGQPIMATRDRGIEILLRQPGMSMKKWAQRYDDPYFADSSLVETLQDFAQHGDNPFVKIFEETYRLGKLGYVADPHSGNVLVDTGKRQLNLVDQCDEFHEAADCSEQNLERFKWKMPECVLGSDYKWKESDAKVGDHYKRMHAQITEMAEAAYETVHARHAGKDDERVGFANTEAVKAVALTQPPYSLVRQLQTLERLARG